MDYKIDEPFENLWIAELEDGELKKHYKNYSPIQNLPKCQKMVLKYVEISLDRLDEILVKNKSYWGLL